MKVTCPTCNRSDLDTTWKFYVPGRDACHKHKPEEGMKILTTRDDLGNWVDDALGADGTPEMIRAVTDYLQRREDRPAWGADWSDFLASLDIWHIVTGLHL